MLNLIYLLEVGDVNLGTIVGGNLHAIAASRVFCRFLIYITTG